MNTLHLAITLSLFRQLYSQSVQVCPKGHRLQTTTEGIHACIQCEVGLTYQPYDNHSSRTCLDCSQVENPDLEIVVTKCNITHNALLLCRTGYYRYKATNPREKDKCEKCSECDNSARKCTAYNNTVCCPSDDHETVVVNSVVLKCLKTSMMCGAGQYMKLGTTQCIPCPEGFFMSDSNHTNSECKKCAVLSNNESLHSVIVRNCTESSPTIFGCTDGYFRDDLLVPVTVKVKCSPCQVCLREARRCDMNHNAVCHNGSQTLPLSQDLLSVADTSSGENKYNSGAKSSPICPDGYYNLISDGSEDCPRCGNSTPTSDHTLTVNPNDTTTSRNWTCYPNANETHIHGEFRTYSVVLFTIAILVDILYVYLYSRTFLKKVSIRIPRRNTSEADRISRMCGTVCLDLHFVLVFMHLFGVLCEVGVINMSEDVLWAFTIAVGVISLAIYFADAILFIVVKRVVSLKMCFPRRRQNTRYTGQSGYDDGQIMIGSTNV